MTVATDSTTAAPVTEIHSHTRTWTRAEIYRNPDLSFLSLPPSNTTMRFTPAFLSEVERETFWRQAVPTPTLPEDIRMAVGCREMACPLCTRHGIPVLHMGETTGLPMLRYVDCECRPLIYFWDDWKQTPRRFRDVDLATVAPIPELALSEARQAAIIAALRKYADDSLVLWGPPGTGKTHMMYALYRAALMHSVNQQIAKGDCTQSVWRVNATALMTQTVAWAMERNKEFPDWSLEPEVTPKKIAAAVKAGFRPFLAIDELDKVAPTDFKVSGLCDVIDCIYAEAGQVVATLNKSADVLAEKWGDDAAGTVLRRIGSGPGAHTIRFVA